MTQPLWTSTETQRLAALCQTGLLDTPPEERFDRLTRMAAQHFGVPVSLISLVDAERQWFKSHFGLEICETHRDHSFCSHAIQTAEGMQVRDATEDVRFNTNPLVTGTPHIRFYAGVPLFYWHGERLGTLCLIDHEPRQLSTNEWQFLVDLAAIASREIQATRYAALGDELTLQTERMRTVFNNMRDSVVLASAQGVVLDINHETEVLFGYTRSELIGASINRLMPPSIAAEHHHYLTREFTGPSNAMAEIPELTGVRSDGKKFPLTIALSSVHVGAERQFVAVIRDLTEEKAAAAAMERLAFYDPLTEVPNRRLFLERLSQVANDSARTGYFGALILLDLDDFKVINDSRGHSFGDALLHSLTQLLSQALPEGGLLARIGGDEFVLVLQHLDDDRTTAHQATEKLVDNLLKLTRQPLTVQGDPVTISLSFGITLFNGLDLNADDLLAEADIALYQSKRDGKARACFYTPAMQAIMLAEQTLLDELKHSATQPQDWPVLLQPQVNTDGQCVGAEVLLRWQHPTRGLLTPDQFLDQAEQAGLLIPVGYFVLRYACNWLAHWQKNNPDRTFTLSVNISPTQFRDPILLPELARIITESGVSPTGLQFEITESVLIHQLDDVVATMMAVKKWGIRWALDDFGTGYSSLSYLRRLPLAELKIDRSFIRFLASSKHDQAIVHAIAQLGNTLGFQVLAEGIETQAQWQRLKEFGCQRLQGYYFSRPLTPESFAGWLADQS
ncbi:EAL domain-containing protein [Salinispirillum marinum]|uniref:EAL domain-containing protein n=2 Tax=Saccharospirillaceae TaxID=255527 RepID=A0ABV8BDF9_9GAMM